MMNQKDQWSDDDPPVEVKKFDSQRCSDCEMQHEILNPTDIGCQ